VVRRTRPEIVLTDLMLPDMDGLALLKEIKEIAPEALVIMITGFATVDSSVEAIQAGAYDYIPKPFTATQLRILIGRAAQQVQLARDNALLRSELKRQYGFENIVGTSEAIQKVFSIISRVAPTDASVFVSGESGTGKELIARAIHTNSRRSERPFVAINCAALPDHLLESELFGHEKGSFTGADGPAPRAAGDAAGRDVLPGRGLGDEPGSAGEAAAGHPGAAGPAGRAATRDPGGHPVGLGDEPGSRTAVKEGVLRQDLFYRLNVVPLRLPPLRERPDDVPALAQHFLKRYAREYDRPDLRLSPPVVQAMRAYEWPGNVRELQNLMERVVSLSLDGQEITLDDLPAELLRAHPATPRSVLHPDVDQPFHDAKAEAISQFEKEYLRALLARTRGNISQAARVAGIDRKTIHRMLDKYEISGAAN
jgi:DNA-binding NtrC family response regulator